MLDTVVMSGDDVCCSVVFGTLVGVFVFSVMWSELLMTSAISCPLWSSVYECQRVECAFTSPVRTECGMFVMYCMLSQRTQAAVQIVSNLPAPSNGGPIQVTRTYNTAYSTSRTYQLEEFKQLIHDTHAEIITIQETKLNPKTKTPKVHNFTTVCTT